MLKLIKKRFRRILNIRRALKLWYQCNVKIQNPKNWGKCSDNVDIRAPLVTTSMKNVFIDDYCIIQPGATFIIGNNETLQIKKYCILSYNVTIVTGEHTPTVGIPRFLLGPSHINDKVGNVLIEEDSCTGTGATILSGCVIGRGAMVAAGAIVKNKIPPYAICGGVPAKIIGVKFSIDQIIEHEKVLYPEEERFSRDYLEGIFESYYKDKKVLGTSYISEDDKNKLNAMRDSHGIIDYSS